jgi:hypothetical protein
MRNDRETKTILYGATLHLGVPCFTLWFFLASQHTRGVTG